MEKKKIFTVEFIAGVGILTALEVILYLVGTLYLNVLGININLALLAIALGAILYGPYCGLFLGLLNAFEVLITPSNWIFFDQTAFGPLCVVGTPIICIFKSALAGLFCGYVFKLFKKNKTIGAIIASLVVPVVNTGVFLGGAAIFYETDIKALALSIFTFNMIIEVGIVAILSPAIARVVQIKLFKSGEAITKKQETKNEEE